MLGNDYAAFKETKQLAETLGYKVVHEFLQNKPARSKYLIGSGKLKEIKDYIDENYTDVIIYENLLSSSQILATENFLGIPVMDKLDLILNVFELRAKSKEALIQIELARLKRKMQYIKKILSRQVKTEHPGFGGSGEYIIHSTITQIYRRIRKLEKYLREYEQRILHQTLHRKKYGKIVTLSGYTNAGKTTLFNAITDCNEAVKDELFTTLSIKTSKLTAEIGLKKIFINDSIGFLYNLPAQLIYAFRSTLSIMKNSDIILVILDGSEPFAQLQAKKKVCDDILRDIDAYKIPTLYVINKCDKINDAQDLQNKITLCKTCISISALKKTNLENLISKILLMSSLKF